LSERIIISSFFILSLLFSISAIDKFDSDILKSKSGDLKITFIGHATLMFNYKNLVIHIDPVSNYADYSKLPKADIILVTHDHGDHLDVKAIDAVSKDDTKIFMSEKCLSKYKDGTLIKNGDTETVKGIKIEAVPAYNIVNMRQEGMPYHPKGEGNGYVLSFDDLKIYIAGDTENIPEMAELKNIYAAFLPMNLPYTMTPEMVFEAVKLFNPKILYPYHFGDTDTSKIVNLLKSNKNTEVRIRKLK
jgi:L-ascorbate metabolism protein UlaG (beta-lactamase superfamily)